LPGNRSKAKGKKLPNPSPKHQRSTKIQVPNPQGWVSCYVASRGRGKTSLTVNLVPNRARAFTTTASLWLTGCNVWNGLQTEAQKEHNPKLQAKRIL
jgi:hypothetical protein